MTIKIDINVSAIVYEGSSETEKAVAFEIFANENLCYQRAFIPSKSQRVATHERGELLGIKRALGVCASYLEGTASINVFAKSKGTLEMLRSMELEDMDHIPNADMRQLRGVCSGHLKLIGTGCRLNYNQSEYKESTLALMKNVLETKIDAVYLDEIKEVLSELNGVKSGEEDISTGLMPPTSSIPSVHCDNLLKNLAMLAFFVINMA